MTLKFKLLSGSFLCSDNNKCFSIGSRHKTGPSIISGITGIFWNFHFLCLSTLSIYREGVSYNLNFSPSENKSSRRKAPYYCAFKTNKQVNLKRYSTIDSQVWTLNSQGNWGRNIYTSDLTITTISNSSYLSFHNRNQFKIYKRNKILKHPQQRNLLLTPLFKQSKCTNSNWFQQ